MLASDATVGVVALCLMPGAATGPVGATPEAVTFCCTCQLQFWKGWCSALILELDAAPGAAVLCLIPGLVGVSTGATLEAVLLRLGVGVGCNGKHSRALPYA